MLIKVEANVWYILEHHTTRRNDYTTGESNFCQTWYSQQLISSVKKSFFETLTRLLIRPVEFFLRIFCAYYTYVKCSLESKQTFGIT